MSGAMDALRDGLDDVAAVLDGPKDRARHLADLCDPAVEDWLTDPSLRALGLIGLDGERPQVVAVEVRAVGGQLTFIVIIDPAPGTVQAWFGLDVMTELGPVAIRGGEVLVELI